MKTTKTAVDIVEDSIGDVNREEELHSAPEQVARTPPAARRKPPGYIAAQMMTDPDSVWDWAYGAPPDED